MSAQRIVVRSTNWLGDAVMSIPALRALREHFPQSRIAILGRPWAAELYAGEPYCDEFLVYRDRLSAVRLLRAGRFDLAVLLPNSFDSALTPWLARVPRRVGYARDGRSALLTEAIARPRPSEIPEHERFYYLELLRRAGWLAALPADPDVRLSRAAALRARGKERFAARGWREPVIGVSPGAAYGGAKRWLPERFAEAARRVACGGPVAVFGSREERSLCDEVARAIGSAHNFAGETRLGEFLELAAACRVLLTNDSGAMHVATAVGTPSVTVFGPTNERATGPAGALARIVREPVECSPCGKRECPIDHRCMTRVSAERVADAAREVLGH